MHLQKVGVIFEHLLSLSGLHRQGGDVLHVLHRTVEWPFKYAIPLICHGCSYQTLTLLMHSPARKARQEGTPAAELGSIMAARAGLASTCSTKLVMEVTPGSLVCSTHHSALLSPPPSHSHSLFPPASF